MTDLSKIPTQDRTALEHIYEEYLTVLERHEPSDDPHGTYNIICDELERKLESTKKSMSDMYARESVIKEFCAILILWWIWNDEVKKNVRPEQNTDTRQDSPHTDLRGVSFGLQTT